MSKSLFIDAQPFAFELYPGAAGLVIIDMQRDFLEEGGFGASLGNNVALLAPIIPQIARMLALFRELKWPVIHTREGHRADLSDCPPAKLSRGKPGLRIGDVGPMGRILIQGQAGHEIIAELAPIPGETVIDKPGKGAFYHTSLGSLLGHLNLRQLLIAGVTTEVCVQTTMREANDRGYECLLLEDCTESYFPAFKAATLEMVRAQGAIVGWTAESRAVVPVLQAWKSSGAQ